MKIKQFQELYYIVQSKEIDFDKSVKMVGVITGQTPDEVDKMPMDKFNKICKSIQKEFEIFDKNLLKGQPAKLIKANGRWYRLHYRIDRQPIDAGRYVEVVTFGKDVVNNLHKILASIAQPVKFSIKKMKWLPYDLPHQDIATDMESANFEAAYHAAVFFYTHYRISMQLIQPYLIKELTAKGTNREEVIQILNGSLAVLDGFTMPAWSLNLKTYLLNRYGN